MSDAGENRRLRERFARAYEKFAPLEPRSREHLERELGRTRPPRRRSRWLRGLFTPAGMRIRPVAAVLGAFALLLFGFALGRWMAPETGPFHGSAPAQVASPDVQETHAVQFILVAPHATNVHLVGDFNGWNPVATPMSRDQNGATWSVELRLPEGRYIYSFVLDGRTWKADPTAPLAPADEFGVRNSVVLVGNRDPA